MKKFREYLIEEQVEFQIENDLPLCENTFRVGTDSWKLYWSFLKENKNKYYLTDFDKHLLETDIGLTDIFENQEVLLDYPFINEKYEDEELNSPKRGGSKKFYVYVKNDKGNIIKVEFGDTTGLNAKINNPDAVKGFVARHDCSNKNDKTTPGYWSCRLPYYAKQLGLAGGGKYFW